MFGKLIRSLMGGRNRTTIAAGEAAPPFSLGSTDGKRRSLKEGLTHGPVLAAFFKVSCPTCQYAFPFLERMYQQLRSSGAKDLQIWGIVQDEAEYGREFARELGITFPILTDEEPFELSREYGLNFVPSIFLIAPNGRVKITSDGFSRTDFVAIQKSLAAHFSLNPPALFIPSEKVPEFKPG
ncbi:MAG: peroxiredoxin family protein [Deltaproteobacteria bacterium]